MSIQLEGQDKLLSLVSGMYHLDIKDNFRLSVLGITNDGFLVIYDDNGADLVSNGSYLYNIKRRVKLSSISNVLNEKVYCKQETYYPYRLNVISKTNEDSFVFYFNKNEIPHMEKLISLLRKNKVKVSKRNVSLE